MKWVMINPSENNIISQICCRSGTIIVTGRKRAFKLSGSSVLPAYPGFMVMKIPVLASSTISLPSNVNFFKPFFMASYHVWHIPIMSMSTNIFDQGHKISQQNVFFLERKRKS